MSDTLADIKGEAHCNVCGAKSCFTIEIKRDEFHFDQGCQSVIARLESPDEALVEAVISADPNVASALDPEVRRAVIAAVIEALARTLTEGKENSDGNG